MSDPLTTLCRLNQQATDAAQIELAAKVAALAEAEAAAAAARAAVDAELAAAQDVSAGDCAVEAFVTWLPSGQRHIAACDAAVAQRQADVDLVRAAVAAARTATETVRQLIATKAERREAEAARQDLLDAPQVSGDGYGEALRRD